MRASAMTVEPSLAPKHLFACGAEAMPLLELYRSRRDGFLGEERNGNGLRRVHIRVFFSLRGDSGITARAVGTGSFGVRMGRVGRWAWGWPCVIPVSRLPQVSGGDRWIDLAGKLRVVLKGTYGEPQVPPWWYSGAKTARTPLRPSPRSSSGSASTSRMWRGTRELDGCDLRWHYKTTAGDPQVCLWW